MKKLYYLIALTLILGLVLTGCLLSNVGQVPTSEQSGIAYLTKGSSPVLVARWKLDEESGATIVTDNSGNDNSGDIYGATPGVVGQFGKALSFDGNDYVRVLGSSSLTGITSVITVEAWLKFSNVSDAFYIRTPFDLTPKAWGLDRYGGKLRFYIYDGTTPIICEKAWTPAVDQWYHIAGTYDGQILKLYVDKNLFQSLAYSGNINSTDQGVVIVARHSDGGWGYLRGFLDEVRIWSSALADSQLDDMTPPVITITTPTDGATYLLNQIVPAEWSADDGTGTGVASASGTVPSGDLIDTSTVEENTFEVIAIDYAKNEATTEAKYNVNYVFNGFQPPVSLGKPFKLGSTIPIKFQLTDAQGVFITNALPLISRELLSNGTPSGEVIDGDSSGAANTDNIFRYDPSSNQYIFNLATKGLTAPATYRITINLGDGTTQQVDIGLK